MTQKGSLQIEFYCSRKTNLNIADFVSSSFSYAEFPAKSGGRMIAEPFLYCDPSTARSAAFAPIAPVTPTTIYRLRFITDGHALLIYAPLEGEIEVIRAFQWVMPTFFLFKIEVQPNFSIPWALFLSELFIGRCQHPYCSKLI